MSKPRKRQRNRPEFDTVVVPVLNELRNAGFKAEFLGKTIWNGRVWISAVPPHFPDVYAYHPERKLSLWAELKAKGEKPTPGQRAFLEDHAGSETQAVCWDDVELCKLWLEHEGLRVHPWGAGPYPYYPHGIHRAPDAGGPVTWEEM